MEQFEFMHHAASGHVQVKVIANDDPPSLGCNDDNLGFPACIAKVRYAGGGYQAMFGWIQLVRSTDAATVDYEMDPNFLFPDADVPTATTATSPRCSTRPAAPIATTWIGSHTAFLLPARLSRVPDR